MAVDEQQDVCPVPRGLWGVVGQMDLGSRLRQMRNLKQKSLLLFIGLFITIISISSFSPSSFTSTSSFPSVLFCSAKPKKGKSQTSVATEPPSLLDSMVHDISIINPGSFIPKIKQTRKAHVSAVLFYTKDDTTKELLHNDYNEFAKQAKGMLTVGAVDCDAHLVFCSEQEITKYPTLMIYPPFPMPVFPYQGDITVEKLRNTLYRLIPSDHITSVTSQNLDSFLAKLIAVPKVLLFSDKKQPPVLFKALSNSFLEKLQFGFINTSDEETKPIQERYKVKDTPHIIVVRQNQKKPDVYTGKPNFTALHDFLNVFAETFVLGGGFSDKEATKQDKPWLHERVPEVTEESHQDICFEPSDKSKGLCVIYLRNGGPMDMTESNMLLGLSEKFTSHLADRGTRFRWMWMDMKREANFASLFGVEEGEAVLPSVVVFNPHKRLRFIKLEDEATSENITALMDKIAGGDARFKNVPGQKLPAFTTEKASRAASAKEEL